MTKLLIYIGVAAVAFGIFLFGVAVGETPSEYDEAARTREIQVQNDLTRVSKLYSQAHDLCEAKYQIGLEGDMATAYQLKGRQDSIVEEINEILSRYSSEIRPI